MKRTVTIAVAVAVGVVIVAVLYWVLFVVPGGDVLQCVQPDTGPWETPVCP